MDLSAFVGHSVQTDRSATRFPVRHTETGRLTFFLQHFHPRQPTSTSRQKQLNLSTFSTHLLGTCGSASLVPIVFFIALIVT